MLAGLLASGVVAQTAGPAAAEPVSWAQWLQNAVNVVKLFELSAFVFGGYQFWAGRRERKAADVAAVERARIDSNYQAWQVINSAQGKGGSGGRIEALGDLLRNGVSLAGIRLDDAWLEEVQLPGAVLLRGSLQRSNLARANLAGARLEGADLRDAELVAANLTGADLRGANLTGARLSLARLDGADLRDVIGWAEVRSYGHTSIEGVRGAPRGFLAHARALGAIDASDPQPLEGDELAFSRDFRAI
jgi:hypothetical protein